ncbi:MAG TPA: type III pantothenate kinase [Deltaproteobacteria bacterium]|nr:type III pantothenate kinase [Deltaproteobacteria bacterium]HOM28966.1 type III pantothenate kinase [Deltaproteobacteria bacterium]HPP81060.1 type III pantothenate kinase [Deltaproteobacteria bacterium]
MLAIDVGNTAITAGIFEDGFLRGTVRVSTRECIAKGSFLGLTEGIPREAAKDAVVVGVRAEALEIVRADLGATGADPLVVDVHTRMGIENAYASVQTLGPDRLVAASAAFHLHGGKGAPLVVVDMGTATTIDYVSEQGVFMGGVIAPGMMSAYRGLLAEAPGLPRIEEFDDPPLIGRDTAGCLKAGVVTAHAAMIVKTAFLMGEETGKIPHVVVTGGLSVFVKKKVPSSFIFDEHLILRGLFLVHSLTKGQGCKVEGPREPIHDR